MVYPTIHLNGTSKERLLEALEEAYSKVGDAVRAVAETCPHGRDYYPQGPDALKVALDQHSARMEHLRIVLNEIQDIAEHLPV